LVVVPVEGSMPRVSPVTLVPDIVPQMYSASERPSSTVKHWKPESELPPRTLLATSVRLVSVELMRLCSEVSKTAVPDGSVAPRLWSTVGAWTGADAIPKSELIKATAPMNAEAIACSMPHMVRRLRAL
jgi:hypothetical protein